MSCDKCGSERVASVTGKTSDMCYFYEGKNERHGYVPLGVNIDKGSDDYISFMYCLNCGKIQGEFPVSDEQVEDACNRL